jgi:hypothetical protein
VSRYRLEFGHLYVASEGFRVRLRVRPKTFQDYQGVLQRYVRPVFGERVLAGLRPLDLQAMYQHMTERSLSARTIRYAHVLMKSAMQQAVRWRLLLENPADGLKVRPITSVPNTSASTKRCFSRSRSSVRTLYRGRGEVAAP